MRNAKEMNNNAISIIERFLDPNNDDIKPVLLDEKSNSRYDLGDALLSVDLFVGLSEVLSEILYWLKNYED